MCYGLWGMYIMNGFCFLVVFFSLSSSHLCQDWFVARSIRKFLYPSAKDERAPRAGTKVYCLNCSQWLVHSFHLSRHKTGMTFRNVSLLAVAGKGRELLLASGLVHVVALSHLRISNRELTPSPILAKSGTTSSETSVLDQ